MVTWYRGFSGGSGAPCNPDRCNAAEQAQRVREDQVEIFSTFLIW